MIRHFINVVTLKNLHWNSTQCEYVDSLVGRAEKSSSKWGVLLSIFFRSSHMFVDHLIGPSRGPDRIIDIDIKKVHVSQMRKITNIISWVFVGLYYSQDVDERRELVGLAGSIINIVSDEIEIANMIIDDKDIDLHPIACEMYSKICDVLGMQKDNVIGPLALLPLLSNLYAASLDLYNSGYKINKRS
jgi:hypothetical protein